MFATNSNRFRMFSDPLDVLFPSQILIRSFILACIRLVLSSFWCLAFNAFVLLPPKSLLHVCKPYVTSLFVSYLWCLSAVLQPHPPDFKMQLRNAALFSLKTTAEMWIVILCSTGSSVILEAMMFCRLCPSKDAAPGVSHSSDFI